jgi:hypothetical protein
MENEMADGDRIMAKIERIIEENRKMLMYIKNEMGGERNKMENFALEGWQLEDRRMSGRWEQKASLSRFDGEEIVGQLTGIVMEMARQHEKMVTMRMKSRERWEKEKRTYYGQQAKKNWSSRASREIVDGDREKEGERKKSGQGEAQGNWKAVGGYNSPTIGIKGGGYSTM